MMTTSVDPITPIIKQDQPPVESPRVYIRRIRSSDRQQVVALSQSNQKFHYPWITAPLTAHMYRNYMRRLQLENAEGFAVCLKTTDQIIGMINLNEICRGSILSASISYYADRQYCQQGLMTQAIRELIEFAFHNLGLHRLEAAIRPENIASRKLVHRCGFKFEGLSEAYLFIDGCWRDHERWAIIDNRQTLTRTKK